MIKEEAIEILSDMRAEYNIFSDDEEATRYHALSWAIRALNEQQRTGRKKGKWIYYPKASGSISSTAVYLYPVCSECGREHPIANYCPNCGARMEEENYE